MTFSGCSFRCTYGVSNFATLSIKLEAHFEAGVLLCTSMFIYTPQSSWNKQSDCENVAMRMRNYVPSAIYFLFNDVRCFAFILLFLLLDKIWSQVDCVWNVMAHAQKPDLVFQRNGRVHLNRRGGKFNRLLAVEECGLLVMLDRPCSEVECRSSGYPIHSPVSPSLPLPCVTLCHHVSNELLRPLTNLLTMEPSEWEGILLRGSAD
jgi:hypothetical protein